MTPKKRQTTSATVRKSTKKPSKMSANIFSRRRKNSQAIGKNIDSYTMGKGTYAMTNEQPTNKINTISKRIGNNNNKETDPNIASTEPNFAWLD